MGFAIKDKVQLGSMKGNVLEVFRDDGILKLAIVWSDGTVSEELADNINHWRDYTAPSARGQ